MITPGEIGAINQALAALRARIDKAKEEAGGFWNTVSDTLFDFFYVGGSPRADLNEVIVSGERLYSLLVNERNRIIESQEEMHEEALQIVEIAKRAAGWDRAASIQSFRQSTDVGGAVGEAAKAIVESTPSVLGWLKYTIPLLLVAIILFYVAPFIPRKRQ